MMRQVILGIDRPTAARRPPTKPLPRLPHLHSNRASPLADLAQVRERGYSIEHEETVPGIAGFGFALRYDTPAIDAISCSIPVARLTAARPKEIVAALLTAREKLEATLGRRP